MGTPEFAAVILEKMIVEGFDVASVFTQPDKKIGRKQVVVSSPVKNLALKNKTKVHQPDTLKDESVTHEIRRLAPDLIVVAAYGKILPKEILSIPKFGAINVHASLLPKYRGASPIQEGILAGDAKTGVTIMLMDEGLDTGDILVQERVRIGFDDTAVTLGEKLAKTGAELLAKTISEWVSGKIKPIKQNEQLASQCRVIRKEDGKINWNDSAEIIFRKWKAYRPWPGIFTTFRKKRLILNEIAIDEKKDSREKPGKVIKYMNGSAIQSGKGLVVPRYVQLEGRNKMKTEEFSRGNRDFIGSVLR